MLVVTTRMCFDGEGMKYAGKCRSMLEFTNMLMEGMREEEIAGRIGYLNKVNQVECARFECEGQGFNIEKFRDSLEALNRVDFLNSPPMDSTYPQEYTKLL